MAGWPQKFSANLASCPKSPIIGRWKDERQVSILYCPKCGAVIGDDSRFCLSCGAALPAQGAAASAPAMQAAVPAPSIYAGFWLRFAAILLDGLILGAAGLVLSLFTIVPSAFLAESADSGIIFGAVGLFYLIIIVSYWLYFALFESSRRRATLGKMALGLIVTDLQGEKLSFGRATGRHFGKLISAMICYIGFIMAGFTDRKQALHDMIAGTLVARSAATTAVSGPPPVQM